MNALGGREVPPDEEEGRENGEDAAGEVGRKGRRRIGRRWELERRGEVWPSVAETTAEARGTHAALINMMGGTPGRLGYSVERGSWHAVCRVVWSWSGPVAGCRRRVNPIGRVESVSAEENVESLSSEC